MVQQYYEYVLEPNAIVDFLSSLDTLWNSSLERVTFLNWKCSFIGHKKWLPFTSQKRSYFSYSMAIGFL